MAGKRKAPLWRQAFLRALRRTGNVRASAFEAGVDPGTAYDHRAKDAGFRGKWAGALKAFATASARKARPLHHDSHGPPARSGEELVVRRSTGGDKLVRAAAGRWCARIEESFLDGIEATGCVRTAARAAGISTAALYERRTHYPEFAARWDERAGRAGTQLPALLDAAAVASRSPRPEGPKRRGRARLPAVSGAQALRLPVANAQAAAKGSARRGGERPARREETHEELTERFAVLIRMLKRRRAKQRRAEGWTEVGEGIWLPPGWTAQPPPPPAGAE